MGERWIKEAQDLKARGSSGVMLGNVDTVGVGWHVTVSPSGHTSRGNSYFEAMHKVLVDKAAEPHILIDPLTDEMGQYFPLDRSARAFGNGPIKTNRDGRIRIQIEVVADVKPVFTSYWKPGPNWLALMRAIRSWGIPDVWPSGPLARYYGDPGATRSIALWRTSGHHAHCNAPGNTHWDTGPIDQAALVELGRTPQTITTEDDVLMAISEQDFKDLAQDVQRQGLILERVLVELMGPPAKGTIRSGEQGHEVVVNGKAERLTALQMLRTTYLESATRLPARFDGATPKDADTVLGHAATAAALARELRDQLQAKQ